MNDSSIRPLLGDMEEQSNIIGRRAGYSLDYRYHDQRKLSKIPSPNRSISQTHCTNPSPFPAPFSPSPKEINSDHDKNSNRPSHHVESPSHDPSSPPSSPVSLEKSQRLLTSPNLSRPFHPHLTSPHLSVPQTHPIPPPTKIFNGSTYLQRCSQPPRPSPQPCL